MMITKEGAAETRCYQYELTAMDIDVDGEMRYTTYGIVARDANQNIVVSYPDISTRKEFVEEIIDKSNRFNLDALHLEDLLLDSIG